MLAHGAVGETYRHFDPVNHRYVSTQPPVIASAYRPDGPEFREGASPQKLWTLWDFSLLVNGGMGIRMGGTDRE